MDHLEDKTSCVTDEASFSGVAGTASQLRFEVQEFVRAAGKRGFSSVDQRRRADRYQHGAWPILVAYRRDDRSRELSVPMWDISEIGVAFISDEPLQPGERVLITLYRSDDYHPRIPAVVRHVTSTDDGDRIGCEFVFSDR